MQQTFDTLLACELASAFSMVTGLGCMVTTAPDNMLLCARGYTCAQCALCGAMGRDESSCMSTHAYGMAQAERFGGQYIYFCGRGLTFFVSPIRCKERSAARVTAGPFRMTAAEDFCASELGNEDMLAQVSQVPFVEPVKASRLSTLLHMATGYLSGAAAVAVSRERDASDAIQGQISAYMLEVKQTQDLPVYPYDKERALLRAMLAGERAEAQRLLNELLGHILVTSGASFSRAKAYINALLVVIERAVMEHSSDADALERRTVAYFERLQAIADMPELCLWLTSVMNELMTAVFAFSDARHARAIHASMRHIRAHPADRLEMDELARIAGLSPAYFARVFKEETGHTVRGAVLLSRLRKAEELMRYENLTLSQIAQLSGFQDQSYFCRVFRRTYGVSPGQYRAELERNPQ